jgi:hypothetical protein
MRERFVVSGLSACLVVGCGGGGTTDAGESSNVTGVSASNGEETASNSGSSGPEGNGDGDGDSNSGPDGNGDGDPGDGDPGDGDPGDGDGGFKFDIHGIPDTELDCQCGTTLDFSYIWIANSTQSTVTKLNTETMEGRAGS